LNRERVQEDPEASLIMRWTNFYKEDSRRKKGYNTALISYKKDLQSRGRKSIRSFSTVAAIGPRNPAVDHAAGDRTTWGMNNVERRVEVSEDPLKWLAGQEEEEA
jgi:hypothetical protein